MKAPIKPLFSQKFSLAYTQVDFGIFSDAIFYGFLPDFEDWLKSVLQICTAMKL